MSLNCTITAAAYLITRATEDGWVTVAQHTADELDIAALRKHPAFRVHPDRGETLAILCVRDNAGEWWQLATAEPVMTRFGYGIDVTWMTHGVPCESSDVDLMETELRLMADYYDRQGDAEVAVRLRSGVE